MKRIFIIRHAKSDHGPQYSTDFERPLNPRGRRDAAFMADKLAERVGKLDGILASSSQRTRETAAFFIDRFSMNEEDIHYSRSLYLPNPKDIWKAIQGVVTEWNAIAVFAHNPAVEEILNTFTPGTRTPTSSIIELAYGGETWSAFGPDRARFITHMYPKLYV